VLINYIQPCGSTGRLSYEFGEEKSSWKRVVGRGRDHAGSLCVVFEGKRGKYNLYGLCALYYRNPAGEVYATRMYPTAQEALRELKSRIDTPEELEAWMYKMLEKGDAKCS
jgi:hypothetical protein